MPIAQKGTETRSSKGPHTVKGSVEEQILRCLLVWCIKILTLNECFVTDDCLASCYVGIRLYTSDRAD